MLLLTKFLIFLTSIFIFLLFNAISFAPKYFFLWAGLIVLIVVWVNLFILRKKSSVSDKLFFLLTPVVFVIASLSPCIFFSSISYKFAFSIAVGAIIFLYLENLFAYFYTPAKYHIYSLENISGYINLISIFFISFSAYGIKVLFGMDFYWVIGLTALNTVLIMLFIYQLLWINKILNKDAIKYIFIACFILAEIYLAIFFLPGSFYSAGLIFVLAYYVLMGIIRYRLLDKLEKKIIIKYLSIGISMFILLLITAKWT